MAKMIIAVLLLFVRPALAADSWTDRQITQQAGVTFLLAIDWAQTRDIKNHPGFYEANSILGEHPTDREVDQYFAATAIGHAMITHFLPSKWRDAWQYIWIGAEANTVNRNHRLGVRFDF